MEDESDTSLISKKFWKYVINLKRGRGRARIVVYNVYQTWTHELTFESVRDFRNIFLTGHDNDIMTRKNRQFSNLENRLIF